ncbi:hypothetical protein N0V90_009735 [Kalmusia sp. IMI 367209]|nr:hypothetical protein N0V90_009735 [Kalmusia sp. IMI 367209]
MDGFGKVPRHRTKCVTTPTFNNERPASDFEVLSSPHSLYALIVAFPAMPPVVPRKRLRSDSPKAEPPSKRAAHPHPRHKEPALTKPPTIQRTLSKKKKAIEDIFGNDDSELSEPTSSEDEFEDVPIAGSKAKGKQKAQSDDSSESEDEEWEDALGSKHHTKHENEPAPVISGDLELTLDAPTQVVFSKPDGKKGPSKIERQIRNVTHCMHVQFLMFHNLIRNAWISDQEVQKIMVEHLTAGCWKAVNRYWRDAGIADGPKRVVEGGWSEKVAQDIGKTGSWVESGKKGVQVYESPQKSGKSKGVKPKATAKANVAKTKAKDTKSSDRNQRDWGATSERLEPATPNLSAGDPLLRLLNYLAIYWRGKFKISAPSLHKRGYLSPSTLEAEVLAWKEHNSDANAFGERIENLNAFKTLARKCSGSRDVGEQLFTSMLRGLGVEARMVASLQPAGFRWSKAEEGKAKDLSNLKSNTDLMETIDSKTGLKQPGQPRANGNKDDPIDLSESELSSAISISSGSEVETKILGSKSNGEDRYHGRTLPYPTYWTEAISNLTHTSVSISVLPRIKIASPSSGEYSNFVSTVAYADKGHQVFAYAIAFSSDGSAKEVTTRYLRSRWPGVTKGYRMPVEKIPIHNKRGKVKRWEEWNWFKSVLRSYARPRDKRQPWDEVEDEGDLVPLQPTKPKGMDEEGGKETLQGYKTSAQYVLERHLRREEALKPDAKIVRHFVTGKGENLKQEPVYLREDIVTCKSVESWHKEGREVKEGEQPLKFVPMRAVTVQRKREIEEREREEGEKVKQGLYSEAQTDWIIPDPIVDGKIPRNAFGNIDVYVPTMIPRGAIHIPLKGTARICRKLNIDYAEACTGFEFGKQRAVPVITGVVVATENEDLVIDAWEEAEEQKLKKAQDKREKLVLSLWKKFLSGLRIVERLKRDYGEDVEIPEEQSDMPTQPKKRSEWETFHNHTDFEGGFMREEPIATDGSKPTGNDAAVDTMGGFMPSDQEDAQPQRISVTIDHGDIKHPEQSRMVVENAYQTPVSLHSMHQKPAIDAEGEGLPEDSENEDASDDEVPIPPRSSRGRKPPSVRGRGRGRGSQRTTMSTRKSTLNSEDGSSLSDPLSGSPVSDAEASNNDSEAFTPASRGKRKMSFSSPAEGRSVPKRKAARKSDAQVKSHFFAHGSDEETDATDRSPQKSSARTRGDRGRGRGRKRGREKAT